jgi:Uncharacterized protein involved in tolerance to divalent cations
VERQPHKALAIASPQRVAPIGHTSYNGRMSNIRQDADARMVYVTCPDRETAGAIASALVENHEAACVNIVPGLESVYRWQGRVEVDAELLLLIKTTADRLDDVQARVQALHPDDVPELVAVHLCEGSSDYLDWLAEQTRAQ